MWGWLCKMIAIFTRWRTAQTILFFATQKPKFIDESTRLILNYCTVRDKNQIEIPNAHLFSDTGNALKGKQCYAMLCYAVQCKWNGCDWMKMIEAKPNQIYSRQPIQTSLVCVRLFSAHFMHTHVPQSRLEISNKEVFAMVRSSRERCFRMQFQCVLSFPFVYFFFSHSWIRLPASFFVHPFLLTDKQQSQSFSVFVCAFT